MADLGIFIKTTFDNKGVRAAEKSFDAAKKSGSKTADKLKQSFAGFGSSVKNVGKDVASNLGPAALAGPAAAITALAAGMATLAVSSLKLAEEARSVESAFNSLSGGASVAVANMEAMRIATKGLVSETEQMRIANQLLGMNIVSTADQLEEVVGVSRRLGKEFAGIGAKDAANEFAIMIANMSVARLDTFGISSGDVRKRIEELMRATEGMTREAAFFQATMEEGNKTIARLGPELNTTADETAKLSAEWANFRAILGETAESTGILKGLAKGLSDNLVLLQSWSDAGADVAKNQQALEIQIARTERTLENNTTGLIKNSGAAARNRVKLAELRDEYARVTGIVEANTDAAKKQQDALQAAIRSEEIAAENLAKREAATKKFAIVQEKFARDLVDIQNETQEQLSDSQSQFDEDAIKAAESHAKSIASVQKRFAKDEEKAAKRAQKGLVKIDANLKKSLTKQGIDEGKRIAKAQSDFVKEDSNTQKRKQIDALADERLFQFELRNLAADGQGIAIKQALERREIEQQIASEKAEFEKDVEQESRKDQIDSMRQEGQEARSQLQQQATERKADLELRNQEAAQSRAERLQEEIIQENESFTQKKADLNNALTERNGRIKESEQERVAEIAKGLAETEDLTNAQFDKMIALAEEFGPKFGQTFADGMTKAFSEALDIEKKIKDSNIADIGAGAGGLPVASGVNGSGASGGIQPFATGGFIDQSGLGFLHKGEEVANPTQGQSITIGDEKFAVREAGRMASAINAMRQRDMQELVDTVAANL